MNFVRKLARPVSKSVSNVLYKRSIRSIVHSSSSDRSFRVAHISDLNAAQQYRDKITTTSSKFDYPDRAKLQDRDMTKQFVLDLSHPQGYKRGHIPGAINVPTTLFDFSKPIDTFDGIKDEDVVELLKYLGISQDTSEIVLYDNTGLNSCRMWLLLRYYGVTNIRILNGGYGAWQKTGLPVSELDVSPKSTTNICQRKSKREYLVTKPSQMSFLFNNSHSEFKFIDTRSPEAFKKYNIKGSTNIPHTNFLEDATFKSIKDISSIINSYGFDNESKFKVYSEQRFSSAVAAFCFELVGRNVSVYDAGINNWKLNFEEVLSDDAREFLSH